MNNSTASGVLDQAKGKIKQAVGETFNNQSLANEGAADQVKGHAKEAWGNVKDATHNLGHSTTSTSEKLRAEEDAHDAREHVTAGAAHVKDSIQRGIEHLEHKANR
jgi:uncharacterized protein YjbJ (UPF0337 family)